MNTNPSLAEALGDYLALRRALGFKLAAAGRLLGQFVDYLSEHGDGMPTTDDALAWANLPPGASANWRAIRLSVVRGFASYLHSLDVTVEVPSADLIRHGPDRATPSCIPTQRSVGSWPQPANYGQDSGRLPTRR